MITNSRKAKSDKKLAEAQGTYEKVFKLLNE